MRALWDRLTGALERVASRLPPRLDARKRAGVRPARWAAPGRERTAAVGWTLDAQRAGFLWSAPRRVTDSNAASDHGKSVLYCPAVRDNDARIWEVPCPIDLRLRFRRDEQGRPALVDVDGDKSAIRPKHLGQMVTMVGEKEWRHPARPIIQVITPYIFLADEPVWMTQMPPVSHFQPEPWPGIVIGGRLPIHIWPRHMMWAFEWWDTARELVLKRNEPWFHVRFETHDPSRSVRVIEAEMTPALREYMIGLSSVANYVNRTFSLFKTARERRPARLLVEKRR